MAASFIAGGIDTLRHPQPKVPGAQKVVASLPPNIPGISNTEQLVKVDAAAKILGGTFLALGKLPRLSALGLAASLVPTTLAGHRFWEETDPAKKALQQTQFLKNLSVLGGLILAAVDTEGRPSVGWRTRNAASGIAAGASEKLQSAGSSVHSLLPTS